MSSKVARRALSISGAAVLALTTLLVPQAAFADTLEEPTTDSSSASAPMTVVSYDAAVAEANGYQIVTNPDGTQSSIPVTDEAKAQQAAADAAKAEYESGGVSARGVVDGDCGSSWISASKIANDTVAYQTGYIVWGAVVDSQWTIVATGFITGNSVTLHPGANAGTWETEGGVNNVVGPGVAGVTTGSSFAVLAGGQVCYSGGPTATFG
jgi:hypothetical protein